MTALFISLIGLLCLLEHAYAFSIQGRSRPIASSGGRLSALYAIPSTSDDQLEEKFEMIQLQQRRQFIQAIATAGIISTTITPLSVLAEDEATTTIDPSISLPNISQKVYLDIKFANYKTPKRLVIGLFGNDMPNTVENFVKLCTNSEGDGPSYAGSTFYRGKIHVNVHMFIDLLHSDTHSITHSNSFVIILALSGMSIQGGAIGANNSGKSGLSSFEDGKPFQPDNYNIKHTKEGLVSMVRTIDGSIDSRFFIQTEDDAGWADDRYAAFGIVLEEDGEEKESVGGGMDLVRRISNVDVKPPQNYPKDPIMIVGCGLIG